MRRRVFISFAFVLLAAAVSVALWWVWRPREGDLGTSWEAVVATIAGGAAGVRDGDVYHAQFSDPFGIAAVSDGSVYVSDAGDAQQIRRITADRIVSTVAGGGPGFADGAGASAQFDTPSGLAIAADGTIYIADTGNNAIRRLSPDGSVSTAAGDGIAGYLDGAAARFNGPIGVAVDAANRVIVADTYNDRIRTINPDGTVATLAGDGLPGYQDGPAMAARFNTPCGVASGNDGNIYIADTGNDAVRVILPSGVVSTVFSSQSGDLSRPIGIAVGPDGVLYVTDDRGRVLEVSADGVRVLAGSLPGLSDGLGSDARFRAPSGVAFVGPGRIVVADPRNAAVRMIAARSRRETGTPVPPLQLGRDAVSALRVPLLWPFTPFEGPHEITGTLGEPRGTQSERLHAGLDIQASEGTAVHAVRAGVVVDPVPVAGFGTISESLRIGSLAYVHVRIGRERQRVGRERRDIPFDDPRFVASYDEAGQVSLVRVKRGARFQTGEPVGTVNAFNHVHLNVGWPGEETNPLDRGLVRLEDTVPPTIARNGIRLFRDDWQPLTIRKNRRLLVSGLVRIVVDAWDQVNGNARRRRLGVYRLGYQILHPNGGPAPGFDVPRETMTFDRMPADANAARLVYASGTGIPEYGRRSTRFLYVVTTTLKGGVASAETWDTTSLRPGNYVVRIVVADIRGNVATANRDLPITIEPATLAQ